MSHTQQIQVLIRSNGLGTAGFVVSLISFFCCGLTAPIGLAFSLFALLWAPRGMAFAGVVLGALGSWWLFAGGLAMLAAVGVPVGMAAKDAAHARQIAQSEIAVPVETEEPAPVAADSPAAFEPIVAPESPKPGPQSPPSAATPIQPPAEVAPSARNTAVTTPKLRTWRTATGTFSVEAEFLSMADDRVKLRKADGTEVTVPVDRLSDDDRRWIEEFRRRK